MRFFSNGSDLLPSPAILFSLVKQHFLASYLPLEVRQGAGYSQLDQRTRLARPCRNSACLMKKKTRAACAREATSTGEKSRGEKKSA